MNKKKLVKITHRDKSIEWIPEDKVLSQYPCLLSMKRITIDSPLAKELKCINCEMYKLILKKRIKQIRRVIE